MRPPAEGKFKQSKEGDKMKIIITALLCSFFALSFQSKGQPVKGSEGLRKIGLYCSDIDRTLQEYTGYKKKYCSKGSDKNIKAFCQKQMSYIAYCIFNELIKAPCGLPIKDIDEWLNNSKGIERCNERIYKKHSILLCNVSSDEYQSGVEKIFKEKSFPQRIKEVFNARCK